MQGRVELYLEGLEAPLPPEALGALAEDLKAVLACHLEPERVLLLTAQDARGRRWLRVAVILKEVRPPGGGGRAG